MAGQLDDAPDFSLREVLDTLRRRKWVILQAFTFVTIIGLVTAMAAKPIYGTTAKLYVEPPGDIVVNTIQGGNSLAALQMLRQKNNIETQLALLRSTTFRKKVVERVRSYPSEPVNIVYSPEEKTTIIDIGAEGNNPKAAAEWANAAAQAYVDFTDDTNKEAMRATRNYLNAQVEITRKQLARAEDRLLEFQKKSPMAESDAARAEQVKDALAVEQQARENRNELSRLQIRVAGLKRRLSNEPETVPDVRVVPNPDYDAVQMQLAKLKADRAEALGTYNEGSVKIQDLDDRIASLEALKAPMKPTIREKSEKSNEAREDLEQKLQEANGQLEEAQALSARLENATHVKTAEVEGFSPRQVVLTRLERERELAEKAYLDYTDKLRDLDVRLPTMSATARIMETAPVPTANRNKPGQQVALAAVMGLMLGIGFAFLQEFLDDRVNTSDDIERLTALPTLGIVPTIEEDNCLLIGKDAFAPITESYRALRTSVTYSFVDQKVRALIVTSGHPGEGKSVTSANLAIAMALQGKRVILVDADLRRPSVNRMFRFEQEPGLSSVLAGEVSLEDALHDTPIEGLRVLTSGPLPPNPPELLNSQAMMDLLAEMHEEVDLVILDTPPVIPVTDAQVLASHVDGVILVVEAGQARKGAVKHAHDLLAQSRGRLLGVVLNKIDQSSKGYYYHYYYRGGYGKYGDKRGYGYGYGRSYGPTTAYGPSGGAAYGYNRSGRKLGVGTAVNGTADHADEPSENGLVASIPERLRDWE